MGDFGNGPARILLVEDNPGDVRLVQEALSGGKIRYELTVVGDGAEALALLRREPPYAGAPRPDLVLLDLHLPRVDGHVVLRAIKADETMRHIPVVMLTTSNDHSDIIASYGLRANAVVTKPLDFEQFVAAIHTIEDFWLGIAELPSNR